MSKKKPPRRPLDLHLDLVPSIPLKSESDFYEISARATIYRKNDGTAQVFVSVDFACDCTMAEVQGKNFLHVRGLKFRLTDNEGDGGKGEEAKLAKWLCLDSEPEPAEPADAA